VFGARAEKESMLEIKDAMPDSEVLDHFGLPQSSVSDDDNVYKMISVRGYVSSCEFGCGRYASDRQFIFINGRPVDYSKVLHIAFVMLFLVVYF
jgi:DNA mismatch repair protein PMS2